MINATIIQDSSADGIRITTFELDYPRFIHAELMTHRMFSRNAASSRAIPLAKMHDHVLNNMATPIHWGINESGMQAKEQLVDTELEGAKQIWRAAGEEAVRWSKSLGNQRLHKQIANRVTEPFQIMKTIVTATEWDNWYNLRAHADAQPEICELANKMLDAHDESIPKSLMPGEWHVPYIGRELDGNGHMLYTSGGGNILLEDAKIISASCCAQVSYRKSDDSLDKAKAIYQRLIGSVPCHASPVEHQAMAPLITKNSWQSGYTHMDRNHNMWSGNFRGWIQHRQLLGV